MTSRKNTRTTGKSSGKNASGQSAGGIRKFFQRLCIYGLTLIGMLLVYFVMGGDSRELAGIKNPGENPGVSHSVGKPVMDENGNPVFLNVSEDGDMYGAEMSGSSDSETTLDPDLASELGLSDSGTQGTTENSGTTETPAASENAGTSETPATSESPASGSTSDGSPMAENPGSNYSSDPPAYSSDSSGYTSASPDYSSSSSGYSGDSSSDLPAALNTFTDSSGPTVGISTGSTDDFFPKTPPIRNYKEGVVTGPDGHPRRDEVKILELGRGKPMKNHFGPAVTDFLDLFDFSITPDWIEANWSSVGIVGPLTTRGYRVPISTGPEPSDLVGSLTYYFDSHLELEKITFEGYTGDLDRVLISLKYFNLTKRITSDPNALLYLSEELPGNRRSFLKSYFRLQSHNEKQPNQRYWLTIELYPPEK